MALDAEREDRSLWRVVTARVAGRDHAIPPPLAFSRIFVLVTPAAGGL
jgi:hypothetical protein